ncbi:MAG: hypothetical protein HZY75_04185 [Nocardioidaceae bacterium]|nr:MAG: hypothetical protein HZY75_04185 [Nocardioidaceae bacterium]
MRTGPAARDCFVCGVTSSAVRLSTAWRCATTRISEEKVSMDRVRAAWSWRRNALGVR